MLWVRSKPDFFQTNARQRSEPVPSVRPIHTFRSSHSPGVFGLAWAFVGTRLVHTAIHCSYNRVIHRFYAYIGGYFVLIALWAVLAFGLLR